VSEAMRSFPRRKNAPTITTAHERNAPAAVGIHRGVNAPSRVTDTYRSSMSNAGSRIAVMRSDANIGSVPGAGTRVSGRA